jgi:hypothetical protein
VVTELAVAFVYREVVRSNSSMEGAVAKRKAGIFISVLDVTPNVQFCDVSFNILFFCIYV